ncbi:unnamed protein product [Prunus brigantina]
MAPKPIASPVAVTWYPTLAVVMLAIGLIFTASFFIYEATISRKSRSLAKELITGTVASVFLGFGSLFLLLASGVYLAKRHGELMLLHLGIRPVLIVPSADATGEIMKTNDTIFSNRPKLAISDRLLYEGKDVSTAPHGEHWRRMRSICVLQLLSNKRVQSFRGVREEELGLLVDNVKQSCLLSLPVNLRCLLVELIQPYTVLEWVMTRLLRHPRVLKKVQNEIMGIANSKPDIAEIDLVQMHYLNAVIKETLRLYPPIPLLAPRESTKDVKIWAMT